MTAAVPDPQDEWGCRCWPYSTPPPAGHKHFANGCDRHPERRPGASPAVPDPRFRDQLAKALPESLGPVGLRRRAIPALGVEASVTGYGLVLLDALMPAITAEVEARVQAAANIARIEGRAEALNAACHEIDDDEDAQLLARRAIQWEREAATLRAAAAQRTDDGPT